MVGWFDIRHTERSQIEKMMMMLIKILYEKVRTTYVPVLRLLKVEYRYGSTPIAFA